jgi:hypothetical protein
MSPVLSVDGRVPLAESLVDNDADDVRLHGRTPMPGESPAEAEARDSVASRSASLVGRGRCRHSGCCTDLGAAPVARPRDPSRRRSRRELGRADKLGLSEAPWVAGRWSHSADRSARTSACVAEAYLDWGLLGRGLARLWCEECGAATRMWLEAFTGDCKPSTSGGRATPGASLSSDDVQPPRDTSSRLSWQPSF